MSTFDFAKKEGWFSAIAYYAIRDPRYQRSEVCWSECVEKWKRAKPIHYPSFEEWKCMAAECDETARLVASEREARSSSARESRSPRGGCFSLYRLGGSGVLGSAGT